MIISILFINTSKLYYITEQIDKKGTTENVHLLAGSKQALMTCKTDKKAVRGQLYFIMLYVKQTE